MDTPCCTALMAGKFRIVKGDCERVYPIPCQVQFSRLLHSASLLAEGQSLVYETWPPVGWHHLFVIGWYKYRLGLFKSAIDRGELPPFFKDH